MVLATGDITGYFEVFVDKKWPLTITIGKKTREDCSQRQLLFIILLLLQIILATLVLLQEVDFIHKQNFDISEEWLLTGGGCLRELREVPQLYMLWFNFIFGSNFIFLSLFQVYMAMRDNEFEKEKIF